MSRATTFRIDDCPERPSLGSAPSGLFRTVLNFTGYMEIPSRQVKYICGHVQARGSGAPPEWIGASLKREKTHA